jgi:hypothetical protein
MKLILKEALKIMFLTVLGTMAVYLLLAALISALVSK